MKLSQSQVNGYRENGFLLLPRVIPEETLADLRKVIAEFVDCSRGIFASNTMFDIDPAHGPDQPRIRRLKNPCDHHALFRDIAGSDAILDPVSQLLGGTVRFDHSKLNFKYPDADAEILWHQDWAFYPHTNDDLLAVGVLIEDCNPESGPLRVIPGSHHGPVYDHHHDGVFSGAIADADLAGLLDHAVDLVAPAGSITIHHVRTLHGSSNCRDPKGRPLLLFSYSAVDAFPVFDTFDLDEFNSRILRGEPVLAGRMESVPIRLPLPRSRGADSIYDNQASLKLERAG